MDYDFTFPAVTGNQGGRTYYIASVPFKVVRRLLAVDVGDVLDRSQRNVDPKRALKVKDYIEQNPGNFVLPALTGFIEGAFNFTELMPGSGVGKLTISMDAIVKLFDGQHRSTGINAADKTDPLIEKSSIAIQLFADMDLTSRQQAFSDINTNAKAVSKSLAMTYNHRDQTVQQIAAEIQKVTAWQGLIDYEKNIATKNSEFIFSFRHAIQASISLISDGKKGPFEPNEIAKISPYWNEIADAVGWTKLTEENAVPEEIKTSVAFTAAGLMTLARVGFMIEHLRMPHETRMRRLNRTLKAIDWNRSADFWKDGLVDNAGNMVVKTPAIRSTAVKIVSLFSNHQ